jgi:hypothetical protein
LKTNVPKIVGSRSQILNHHFEGYTSRTENFESIDPRPTYQLLDPAVLETFLFDYINLERGKMHLAKG